ncbi:MAG: hypothetical protein AAF385_05215 [Pseudomonadota bacterium]
MWRNRHVVTALLVAPILALIAYFAVDAMITPNAEALVQGKSYPLKEHSNCRRAGGLCTLSNNELRVQLVAKREGGLLQLKVALDQLADQAVLALLDDSGQELGPHVLARERTIDDEEGSRFTKAVDLDTGLSGLRLVVVVRGANFYASTSGAFVNADQ